MEPAPEVHLVGEIDNNDLSWLAKGSQLKNKVTAGARNRANSLPSSPSPSESEYPIARNGTNCKTINEEEESDGPSSKAPPKTATPKVKSKLSRQVELDRQTKKSFSDSTDRDVSSDELSLPPDMTPLHHSRSGTSSPFLDSSAAMGTSPIRHIQSIGSAELREVAMNFTKKSGWFHSLSNKLSGSKHPAQPLPSTSPHQTQFGLPVVKPQQIPGQKIKLESTTPSPSAGSPKSAPAQSSSNLHGGISVDSSILSGHGVGVPITKTTSIPQTGTSEYLASSVGSEVSRTGSLISKLRRLSTRSPSISETDLPGRVNTERHVLNKNPKREACKVPELKNVLHSRVRFSADVFGVDPPQQIPSRHPKPGNILFKEDGEVVRTHPINPNYILPAHYRVAVNSATVSAHETAARIAASVRKAPISSPKIKGKEIHKTVSEEEEAEQDDVNGKTVLIDTPMAKNKDEEGEGGTDVKPDHPKDKSLEAIYTRCCHLREILPIPATMKQVKRKESPVPILKIVNPRPTLIEVLAFADFISIVPVVIVNLDNCCLSTEMLEVILSSISYSKRLMALSLRNVILDTEAWKLLCAFLVRNISLTRLDISMGASSSISKTKTTKPEKLNRFNANWELLNRALLCRNGIEELLINGCMIPTEQLKTLLMEGLSRTTKRLGLALNDLHKENLVDVNSWMQRDNSIVEGLDLGGNDLDGSVGVLAEIMHSPSLLFLSLNSCDLTDVKELHDAFIETSRDSHLRFLDLSGNPHLFPAFTSTLAKILPYLSNLRRVHLDNEDFSSDNLVSLSESLAVCKKLYHISLLDNPRLDSTACAALTAAVQISSTIYTIECDNDQWPSSLQRRMAHYCMMNMEKLAGRMIKQEEMDLSFEDKNELVDTGTELAKAVGDILDSNKDADELHCKEVTHTMVKRAAQVKDLVQGILGDLLDKREKAELSVDEKEALLRLCLLDVNLERVIERYNKAFNEVGESLPIKPEIGTATPPPSITQHMMLNDRPSHSPLLGSQTNQDLQVAPIGDDERSSSVTLSPNSSTTSLNLKKQDQEEGQILKLSTLLMRGKEEEEDDGSDEDEGEGETSDASYLIHLKQESNIEDRADLQSNMDQLRAASGEQLRKAYWSTKGDDTLSQLVKKLQSEYQPEFKKIFGDDITSANVTPMSSTSANSSTVGGIGATTGGSVDNESKIRAMDRVIDNLAKELKKAET